jgi:hypothetical protein
MTGRSVYTDPIDDKVIAHGIGVDVRDVLAGDLNDEMRNRVSRTIQRQKPGGIEISVSDLTLLAKIAAIADKSSG